MKRKSIVEERREQRDRQKTYRDEQRDRRKPNRDDIARAWLWKSLRRAAHADETTKGSFIGKIEDDIISTLVRQGFDERQCEIAFMDIYDRYKASSSPPFRIKRHLKTPDSEPT